jgi:hypothetical protein
VPLGSQVGVGGLLVLPTEGNTVPPGYRYEQIADDLAERIKSGEFPPGSKLPSRRELIEHYRVTEPASYRCYGSRA